MLKPHRISAFKDPTTDLAAFRAWEARLAQHNARTYHSRTLSTALGSTHVYTLTEELGQKPPLVIFPGARTTSLVWDLDRGLDALTAFDLYLVETNGLPNLSDGATPNIKGLGWGHWAAAVLDGLQLDKVSVAGASFGGLVAMKLALIAPDRLHTAFLLDPGCLAPFDLSWKNLKANLKPIFKPSEANVREFLDTAVFCKPNHALSPEAEQLLVDYQMLALTRYKDRTQKPYAMGKALSGVQVPTYLLHGQADILFPYQKSVDIAQQHLPLKGIHTFPHVGHGIETYRPALEKLAELMC